MSATDPGSDSDVTTNTPSSPLSQEYSEFVTAFPEFQNVPAPAVQYQLTLSQLVLSEGTWGQFYSYALFLYTAHYLAIRYNLQNGMVAAGVRGPFASIGITTSQSASTNGLSQGSELPEFLKSDDPLIYDLGRTEYGLQFLTLAERVIPLGTMVYSPSAAISAMSGMRRI